MSTIKVNAIQHTTANASNMTLFANGNVAMTTANTTLTVGNTTISNSGISVAGAAINPLATGMRNRIINGAMTIDQRNVGASLTPTDGQFTVDRWQFWCSAASKATVQQSTTVPAGFKNSVVITASSSYTAGSSEIFSYIQPIEGLNCYDLLWGSSSALPVTLSFWVRSSLTGTFSGWIRNNAGTRSYVFSYTINSANTWEYKTVTIPGDTTGTWLTTAGVGIYVGFSVGAGATYSTTAGSWNGSSYYNVTGGQSLVGTSGATLYLTGVQLEAGTVATPFEWRHYGQELALCQRYCFVKTYPDNIGAGIWYTASSIVVNIAFPVVMRATPTLSGTFGITAYASGSSYNITNQATLNTAGISGCEIYVNHSASVSTGGHATSARLYSGSAIISAEL
jgi:hypothetical protein